MGDGDRGTFLSPAISSRSITHAGIDNNVVLQTLSTQEYQKDKY